MPFSLRPLPFPQKMPPATTPRGGRGRMAPTGDARSPAKRPRDSDDSGSDGDSDSDCDGGLVRYGAAPAPPLPLPYSLVLEYSSFDSSRWMTNGLALFISLPDL